MAEETVLTADDLMAGPPPPLVLEELADAALAGLDLCNHQLRVLFECLHRHDIEPFCQEEIIRFRRCSQQRDKELRERLLGAEQAYSAKLSSEDRRQRSEELEALINLLDRRLILATGMEGMAGFKQRWQLNGQLHDARSRLQVLKDVDKAAIATTATAAPHAGETSRRGYGWSTASSMASRASTSVAGLAQAQWPRAASSSASSLWWLSISASFTTTSSRLPARRASKMLPDPAGDHKEDRGRECEVLNNEVDGVLFSNLHHDHQSAFSDDEMTCLTQSVEQQAKTQLQL
eukprot:SM000167S02972  [mRNA]  locus=s167:206713:209248:+ [translate_table: standard]